MNPKVHSFLQVLILSLCKKSHGYCCLLSLEVYNSMSPGGYYLIKVKVR